MRAGGVGGVAWLQTGTVQNYSYGTGSSEAHVPLADHMGNVRHYYQFKASGSKVTGQLVASYEYDAFGREVRAWGLNTPATNQPPGLPANRPWADLLPFHYSSKLRDVDSGFNYYGYRFYDPGAGRWLNRDPIGEEGGVNLYGFCQNQPIGLIDVFGGFPAGGYVGGPSGVASFNVDGHGSGKWYPTSPEEKERILAMQQAAIELVIPIEAFRQLMNGNIVAASGDLIMGRLKFLKLARKVGTSRMAHSGGKCCVAIEAQIVKVPVAKGSVSPLTGCGTAAQSGGSSLGRLLYDPRNFQRQISPAYWASRSANGSSLHHWMIPQRVTWVPQGIRNAGWNLVELPAMRGAFHRSLGLNQWMGFARNWGPRHALRASAVENTIRVGIPAAAGGAAYGGYQLGEEIGESIFGED
jgi:RHS repeat-associated protein